MESSKCPKCGDKPHFVEHIEKWYCYGCNSYIEEEEQSAAHGSPAPAEGHADPAPESHAGAIAAELEALEREDDVSLCPKCGAELEEVKDGKRFCYICETYPDEAAPEPKPVAAHPNDAQSLLDKVIEVTPTEASAPRGPEAAPPVPEPAQAPEPPKVPAREVKMCGTCGQPLKWIDKYQRHYCYGCRKYAPKESMSAPSPAPARPDQGQKRCPDCGGELRFVEKYGEHYCYACKRYPFHKRPEASSPGQAPEPKPQAPKCPRCGDQLRFIDRYQRHYCFRCKEYAPKGTGMAAQDAKTCPDCGEHMKFIQEYNEWYCYRCKKYSLRPSKPVLLF